MGQRRRPCRLGDGRRRDRLAEAVGIANTQVSGLAATVVTESATPRSGSSTLSRHSRVLEHADAIHRRVRADGAPETGINVDFAPGPRGQVTYRDLWLRQVRVVGDGTQRR